ncbi:DUF3426 domain-containing protein [Variovorax sp. JS1663]|uniref:DUF3426 domain-containing protein n=1 Tax=Variovorax sp. JS1663 TaxID=1851577 RepID=UPI000B34277F|nr:DUF3426 domain-containing protein [Variovorax sp. JS1663]OUM02317.1 hypothetical protein A8M77_11565 [Variovorax sp. JS1663]
MSLVTRCPACGTTFKVVRDQLRISDGWVRCGRCSEVFDATLELHETTETAPASQAETLVEAPAEPLASQLQSEAETTALPEQPTRRLDDEAEADFLDDEQEVEPPLAEAPVVSASPPAPAAPSTPDPLSLAGILTDEPWPEASAVGAMKPYVPPYPSLPPFPSIDLSLSGAPAAGRAASLVNELKPGQPDAMLAAAVDADDVQLQKALRRARAKSAKIARAKARGEERAARESAPVVLTAAEPEPVPESPRNLPRFAAEADDSPSFWRRLTGRRTLIVVALLAALLLGLQVLRQERDLILAHQPSLRPVLAALCGLTGCELSALRQIGDITIDGASFAREKSGDAYRLSFTLRNAAAVPLAMPAVELSLLDTQERAVVRRVLTPAEFGAPSVLPPRAQRTASLPLAISGPEAAALPPVAGFHLLAFYP